jgi:hypothetical protein
MMRMRTAMNRSMYASIILRAFCIYLKPLSLNAKEGATAKSPVLSVLFVEMR